MYKRPFSATIAARLSVFSYLGDKGGGTVKEEERGQEQ
jgi:hypothetical protein